MCRVVCRAGFYRDSWASVRSELISSHGDNKHALEKIDSALFVLVLEPEAPAKGDDIAKVFLHGDMRQRWFDKLQVPTVPSTLARYSPVTVRVVRRRR